MLRMTRDRALKPGELALAAAWMIGVELWLYPDVNEEFEEKQDLARISREHRPMIPGACTRMRGIENRDCTQGDRTRTRAGLICRPFGGSTRSLHPTRTSKLQPGSEWRMACR
jgi:hypothetical protein